MKYIIEKYDNKYWCFERSYDSLTQSIQFCTIMKSKHPEEKYRIITVVGIY